MALVSLPVSAVGAFRTMSAERDSETWQALPQCSPRVQG